MRARPWVWMLPVVLGASSAFDATLAGDAEALADVQDLAYRRK